MDPQHPPEETADLLGFTPERAHLLLQGVYGDLLHHNDRLHLDGGVTYDAVWKRRWRRIAAQSASWYAMPSGAVDRLCTDILDEEWRGVLGRTLNSERSLVSAHVFLTKTLGICRAREIWDRITRSIDLWERGLHMGLVGGEEAGMTYREVRSASRGEEEDEAMARSYHDTALSSKLSQAVRGATDRGGGLLPDDQCTKTGRLVSEVLWEKHPDTQVHPMKNHMCPDF